MPSTRLVPGTERQAHVGTSALRKAPGPTAEQVSQLLYGERFTVYEERDGWAWGQCGTDGYVGYLEGAALGGAVTEPTHRVSALRSFLYPAPDLRAPPLDIVSLMAPVTVIGERDGWGELAGGRGWLSLKHLRGADSRESDHVGVALRLLGTPYLWGGRTSVGIDCSGLVQIALAATGFAAPRDSDMQRGELGASIGPVAADGRNAKVQAGDIVFFPGHVAFMVNELQVVHATAYTMTVCIEPLADVVARTDPTRGGGLLAVRRL